jgi:hypothetical protein
MDEVTDEQPNGCFVIDGEDYPFPLLYEGFTMAEAMAFHSYTGFPLEELIVADLDTLDEDERADLEAKARSPKTLAGLMHIAYLRGKPGAKEAAVRKIVASTDFVTAVSKFLAATEQEDAEVPPTEPQKNEQQTSSSDGNSVESTQTSGDASGTSSEPPAETPRRIGTSGLGMPATSRQIRQVV